MKSKAIIYPKCKNCKQPIRIKNKGLRDFCSKECKKAHRMNYIKDFVAAQRVVNKLNQCKDTDVNKSAQKNPLKSKAKNQVFPCLGLPEDDFLGFGGKEWYDMAKRLCDNFEVRVKEGYCVTLITPIVRFKKKCSECKLGIGLKGGVHEQRKR